MNRFDASLVNSMLLVIASCATPVNNELPSGPGLPAPTSSAADLQPPTAPSHLFATVTAAKQVYLSWGPSTDNVGIGEYRIFRDDASGTLADTTETHYLDAAVVASTTYIYRVRALDTSGNLSTASDTVIVTTPAYPEVVKPVPSTPGMPSVPVAPRAAFPAQLLDNVLKSWKLTLPIDEDSSDTADEIKQPLLAMYFDKYFKLNEAGDTVVFTTPINGIRTSNNTKYVRTELREVYSGPDAVGKNYWPCSNHSARARGMAIRQVVKQTSTHKPEVGIGQIHDDSNDNLLVKYLGPEDGNGTSDTGIVEVNWNDDTSHDVLDAAYELGDPMTLDISVSNAGNMRVVYRNLRSGAASEKSKQLSGVSGEGCFFKAGNYIQDCVDEANSYTDVMGNTTKNSSCTSGTPASNATQTSIVEIDELRLR